MKKYDDEDIVMGLIVNGGDARGKAMEAIQCAKEGDYDKAEQLIKEANTALNAAHQFQTELLHQEADGNSIEVKLIIVHGQDHLMNAMTVRDLAIEMVELYKKMNEKERKAC